MVLRETRARQALEGVRGGERTHESSLGKVLAVARSREADEEEEE